MTALEGCGGPWITAPRKTHVQEERPRLTPRYGGRPLRLVNPSGALRLMPLRGPFNHTAALRLILPQVSSRLSRARSSNWRRIGSRAERSSMARMASANGPLAVVLAVPPFPVPCSFVAP